MNIIIAPDSYKGSLSALHAAEAIKRGVHRVMPDAGTILVPMADGGEGFVEALTIALQGDIRACKATDPIGRSIEANFGWIDAEKVAIVEVAAASGLPLLAPNERNPSQASSYGTGEVIVAALDQGCRKLFIGLGGSATNDGGIGMAQALGYRFYDAEDRVIEPLSGRWHDVARIDASEADPRLQHVEIIAACDVDALLCGEKGASAVFGPQKGATADMVRVLDGALDKLGTVLEEQMGTSVKTVEGGGAAGGLGAGLLAFCGARLEKGIELVLDACHFNEQLAQASLIITGEGQTDDQTAMGKTAAGIAQRAKKQGVPVICLSGSLGNNYQSLHQLGIAALYSVVPKPCDLADAMQHAGEWLEACTEQVMRTVVIGQQLTK